MTDTMKEMAAQYKVETKRKLHSFKLRKSVQDELTALAKEYGVTKTAIVEIAISHLRTYVDMEKKTGTYETSAK